MRWAAISLLALALVWHGLPASLAAQNESLSVADLIRLVTDDPGGVYVIDVRPKQVYLSGTVPGAVSAPADPAGFFADGRGGPVLLVTGPDMPSGHLQKWRDRLTGFGFAPIHHIDGGFPVWVKRGGAVEKPTDVFVKPGTTPFIIPRGICELNAPAQVFE